MAFYMLHYVPPSAPAANVTTIWNEGLEEYVRVPAPFRTGQLEDSWTDYDRSEWMGKSLAMDGQGVHF